MDLFMYRRETNLLREKAQSSIESRSPGQKLKALPTQSLFLSSVEEVKTDG